MLQNPELFSCRFAYGVGLKLGGHITKISSGAVPLCGTEVNTDAFREG